MRSTSLLILAGVLGCTAERAEDAGEWGQERAAVRDGVKSGPDEDSVVSVLSKDDANATHRCTGTLVAANLLVTAQHCVSNFAEGAFSCTSDGQLTSTSTRGQMGTLLDPARISVRVGGTVNVNEPPAAVGAQVFAPLTTSICKNDIAFLVLDRPIPNVPFAPIRLGGDVAPRDPLRVVGYGLPNIDSRYYRNDVQISRVGPTETRPSADPIAPRTFDILGGVLCEGDSGGPAFADSGALVGVFSLIVGDCQTTRARNVFTQVASFADYAQSAFEAAGATPIVEPGGGTGGSAGSAGSTGGPGGEAGEGGDSSLPTSGGSGGVAGTAADASGGAAGSVGVGGSAGTAGTAGASPLPRGLRQKGGCRCSVPGGQTDGGALAALGATAFLGLVGSRRRSRRR